MKWFKHRSDALNDPFIFDLISRFGGDGYLVFFGTVEIIANNFDGDLTKTCRVSERFLTKTLQVSRQKFVKIQKFCEEKGKLFCSSEGGDFILRCPKLLDYADEYTQRVAKKNRDKIGTVSGVTPKLARHEVEEEEEKEKDNTPPNPPKGEVGPIEKPDEPDPDQATPENVVGAYHAILASKGRPKVRVLGEKLRGHLKARIGTDRQTQSLSWWKAFFENISLSNWHMNRNGQWDGMDLHWILGPVNFEKMRNRDFGRKPAAHTHAAADSNAEERAKMEAERRAFEEAWGKTNAK